MGIQRGKRKHVFLESLGGKGKVQAKAGARKEATAGQVGSRRERVAIVNVEKEAKAARACTGLTLYQKMSGIGMVVLRRHPPCSVLKQVRCQDRQVCPEKSVSGAGV